MDKESLNKKISRREAILGGIKLTTAAAVIPLVGFDKQDNVGNSQSIGNHTFEKSSRIGKTEEKILEEDTKHENNTNTNTAYLVSGTFGAAIGAVASGKVEFGSKTILPVSIAESYRMWQLRTNDKHAFEHEQKELVMSIGLVPVLAAVAETADNTKIYVDSLFETEMLNEDEAEALALEETHAGKHKIEDLTRKTIDECKDYLHAHKDEVIRIAAANAALVTIISPLATTYVGASSAESSFAPMTRALTKAYYAQEIVRKKEAQEEIKHEEILKNSLERAKVGMNGQLGYCNLSLAMAANTSGMAGIGDPPLIYSGILNKSPYNHALVSAEGFVISEAANVAANNVWLKSLSLDANTSFYNKEFMDYHTKTAKALTSAIVDGESRQGLLWGYAGQGKELAKILETLGKAEAVTEANVGQLREHLRSVSHPVLELDISEYLPRKGRGIKKEIEKKKNLIKKLSGLENVQEKKQNEQYEINDFDFEVALNELYSTQTSEHAYQKAKEIDHDKRESNVSELGKILLTVVRNGNAPEAKEDLQEISQSVNTKGALPLKLQLEKLLSKDNILSEDDLKTLPQFFGAMGAQDVQRALAHSLEHYRGSMRDHPHDELLGHASSEVVAALLTQLPAVPSLVHLAKENLPKVVDSNVGEKVPASSEDKKVASVLVATAAISSTADNVAAYLFGKAVLEELFKEEYGENLSYEHKWFANDAALLAAIVGGSLSKVGNGANFLISQVDPKIVGENIDVDKKKIGLAKSYLNPYSITQTATVLTALMAHKKAIDKGLPNIYSLKK